LVEKDRRGNSRGPQKGKKIPLTRPGELRHGHLDWSQCHTRGPRIARKKEWDKQLIVRCRRGMSLKLAGNRGRPKNDGAWEVITFATEPYDFHTSTSKQKEKCEIIKRLSRESNQIRKQAKRGGPNDGQGSELS